MTDYSDLIARLRADADDIPPSSMEIEAADAIERLVAERDAARWWQMNAHDHSESMGRMYVAVMEELVKARAERDRLRIIVDAARGQL